MAVRHRGKGRGRHGSGAGPWTSRSIRKQAPSGPLGAKARTRHGQPVRTVLAARSDPGREAAHGHASLPREVQDPSAALPSVAPAKPARPMPGDPGVSRRNDAVGLLAAMMVPGRAFFTMDRRASGLVCLGLQASLVGWLPAAVWAALAIARVQRKQRALAARLR